MEPPHAEIEWFGRRLLLSLEPATAVQLYAARSVAGGRVAVYLLSVLALVLALPADAYRPWTERERLAREAARSARAKAEAYLRICKEPTAEDRAELVNARKAEQVAELALTAAEVTDIPLLPNDMTAAARRVEAALLAAKMPALQIATLAGTATGLAERIAVAGWEEWQALEASGFSMAPPVTSSAGASSLPHDGKEAHSAGLS